MKALVKMSRVFRTLTYLSIVITLLGANAAMVTDILYPDILLKDVFYFTGLPIVIGFYTSILFHGLYLALGDIINKYAKNKKED